MPYVVLTVGPSTPDGLALYLLVSFEPFHGPCVHLPFGFLSMRGGAYHGTVPIDAPVVGAVLSYP